MIEINTQLDVTAIGQALYIPDYPARVDRIEQQTDIQNLHTEPPQPHMMSTILVAPRMDLIQSYLENVHPSLPFIQKSSLNQPQLSTLLLNAIYAVSSRFVNSSAATQNNDPPGWSYYKKALSLIDSYADAPRLSTVQALVLLAKYHEHIQRPGFFWRTKFFIQLAVKMSSNLGLWKKPDSGTQPSCGFEYEMRARTFWALYAYEVLMR